MVSMNRAPFVIAFLQLLLAPAAFAVDGVLEINQASVAAGGGFPLSIAQAGSYRLTSDLVVPASTNGIAASVDGVRIDLNGFSLAGAGSCSPTIDGDGKLTSVICSGTTGVGVDGVAGLSNGTIRGFGTGILGATGRAIELDRMIVTENVRGLDAASSGSVRITDSRFSVHLEEGADCQFVQGTTIVRNSTFERNAQRGLYLGAGLASHSSFHQNKGEGIRSNNSRAALVESCYFEDNVWGIFGNPSVGYRGNVFFDNTTNVNANPVILDDNLCGTSVCP
jgi:hypothetical protein